MKKHEVKLDNFHNFQTLYSLCSDMGKTEKKALMAIFRIEALPIYEVRNYKTNESKVFYSFVPALKHYNTI